MLIRKVVITKNKDCCRKPYLTLKVTLTDTGNATTQCGSTLPYGVNEVIEFDCGLPIFASTVKISTTAEKKTTLALCEVEVLKIGM